MEPIVARIHKTYIWLYTKDYSRRETHTLAVIQGEPVISLSEDGDKWYIDVRRNGDSAGAVFASHIENGE